MAFFCNSIIERGLPTTLLRPRITTRLPASTVRVRSRISITAAAVEGKKLGKPRKRFPALRGLIPSISLLADTVSATIFCDRWAGNGICTMIPCTDSSLFKSTNSERSSSAEVRVGNCSKLALIPTSSATRNITLLYTPEAASPPTRTMTRPGALPVTSM